MHRWPVLPAEFREELETKPFPHELSKNLSTGVSLRRASGSNLVIPDINAPLAIPQALCSGGLAATAIMAVPPSTGGRARRTSVAERVLEQVRSRDLQKLNIGNVPLSSSSKTLLVPATPKGDRALQSQDAFLNRHLVSRRQSLISPIVPSSPVLSKKSLPTSSNTSTIHLRPPRSASGSQSVPGVVSQYPLELLSLLDGQHHTDELSVRFATGWPVLENWLVSIGRGKGDGDFGIVRMIYR